MYVHWRFLAVSGLCYAKKSYFCPAMKKLTYILFLMLPLCCGAQKVETTVADNWVEIPVQQTQSELKPGWKIVDYQMKSRLTHYLAGGRATQLSDGNRPMFRVTPGPDEVLIDYALIRLKAKKYYRKLSSPQLIENIYTRLEPKAFTIKAESDSFICQPREPLQPGEYILVNLAQRPVGELGDLLVYPFSVAKD